MIEELFNQNQANQSLPDTGVQWLGHKVRLYTKYPGDGSTLEWLSTANVVAKVQRWCVKHGRRCSQIQNGKVML